jgi:hypothetical protein
MLAMDEYRSVPGAIRSLVRTLGYNESGRPVAVGLVGQRAYLLSDERRSYDRAVSVGLVDPNRPLEQLGVQDVVVQDVVSGDAELPHE